MSIRPRRAYVILDRDGTLIVERNYLSDPNQVDLLRGTLAGLARMSAIGLGLIVVTNQSGIARGYFDHAMLGRINKRMESLLAEGGVVLDGIFVCPHHPDDGCSCRKPRPGLALQAAARFGFDPAGSFVIGDKGSDLELGRRIGAYTILVTSGYGMSVRSSAAAEKADAVVSSLIEAAAVIERCLTARGLMTDAEFRRGNPA